MLWLQSNAIAGRVAELGSLGDYVMPKVNTTKMVEVTWSSPKGKFVGAGKEISEELGRRPESTDLNERHPFPLLALPSVSPHAHAREKALT